MRVQQKENNVYVKELDKVDSYLVNIIKRYFEKDQESIWLNREDIIVEAVRRAKEEFIKHPHAFAVTSVNKKTGAVTLTNADIGSEPLIIKKFSAFNKPFGDKKDTVCEGNDPRLSDAREPLNHSHSDEYIYKKDIDLYIEKFLNERGIQFVEGKIKIMNKDLQITNGELEELN